MIVFAIEYRRAISVMTADADNNLRKYELRREEWEILEQLVKVLKVCSLYFLRSTDSYHRRPLSPPAVTARCQFVTSPPIFRHPWALPGSVSNLSLYFDHHHPSLPLIASFLPPRRPPSPWIEQVFKHATLFFSRSTPNLATVIPAMDHIDEVLTTQAVDTSDSLLPSIRAACSLARKTLNRYYERTDLSEMY